MNEIWIPIQAKKIEMQTFETISYYTLREDYLGTKRIRIRNQMPLVVKLRPNYGPMNKARGLNFG